MSAVVPHFNENIEYVRQCLDSLNLQSYPSVEVVVVDDGSDLGSRASVERLVGTYRNARFVAHQTNRGLAAARNTGLQESRGDWITFVDADDYLPIHSIADRVNIALASAEPRMAGVYGPISMTPQERAFRGAKDVGRVLPTQGVKSFLSSLGDCPFSVHAALCRTDIIRGSAGFDETMRHGAEDWDLWYRLMRWGFIFLPTNLSCGFYRQKRGSMVRVMGVQHTAEAQRLIQAAFAPLRHDQSGPSSAPYRFARPLGDYLAVSQTFRRQIYFAALALLGGGDAQAREILSSVAHPLVPYCKDIHPIETVVKGAVARFLGVESAQLSRNTLRTTAEIQKTVNHILAQLEMQL